MFAASLRNRALFFCLFNDVTSHFSLIGEKKLGVGDSAVALPARNQPAAVRLLRIFGVVDDVADGLSHRAAFAGVQGHQACGCHVGHILEKQNGL